MLPRVRLSLLSFIRHAGFDFNAFYAALKQKGFVIYPGKISDADTFRIGNIGDVFPEDMEKLLEAIRNTDYK